MVVDVDPSLLIERDIKHIISERTIPDVRHPEESEYVSHVRKLREEGSDGIRRPPASAGLAPAGTNARC